MNLELVRGIDRQFHETSAEIRLRLSARLGYRIRGQGRDQDMVRALQPQAPTRSPCWQTIRCGLLVQKSNNHPRSPAAKRSLNHARNCPVHGEQLTGEEVDFAPPPGRVLVRL